MKHELIGWDEAKRVWSLRWAILTAMLAAVPVAYMTLPDDWLPAIPQWLKALLAFATLGTAATTAAARVIKQKPPC